MQKCQAKSWVEAEPGVSIEARTKKSNIRESQEQVESQSTREEDTHGITPSHQEDTSQPADRKLQAKNMWSRKNAGARRFQAKKTLIQEDAKPRKHNEQANIKKNIASQRK